MMRLVLGMIHSYDFNKLFNYNFIMNQSYVEFEEQPDVGLQVLGKLKGDPVQISTTRWK